MVTPNDASASRSGAGSRVLRTMPTRGKQMRKAQIIWPSARSPNEKGGTNSPAAGRSRGRLTVRSERQQRLSKYSTCAASASASVRQAPGQTAHQNRSAENQPRKRVRDNRAANRSHVSDPRCASQRRRRDRRSPGKQPTFRPRLHQRHILRRRHRPELDRDRREMRPQRAEAVRKITLTDKLWMLARHQENMTKTLPRQMMRFRHHCST